jgi:hypothetical protein
MFTTRKATSGTPAPEQIVPVRPTTTPDLAADTATRGLLRRTLGKSHPSRRTFGRYSPSRRTFGKYQP